jgi:hypothetical protein
MSEGQFWAVSRSIVAAWRIALAAILKVASAAVLVGLNLLQRRIDSGAEIDVARIDSHLSA